jgi:hypothetical protein
MIVGELGFCLLSVLFFISYGIFIIVVFSQSFGLGTSTDYLFFRSQSFFIVLFSNLLFRHHRYPHLYPSHLFNHIIFPVIIFVFCLQCTYSVSLHSCASFS